MSTPQVRPNALCGNHALASECQTNPTTSISSAISTPQDRLDALFGDHAMLYQRQFVHIASSTPPWDSMSITTSSSSSTSSTTTSSSSLSSSSQNEYIATICSIIRLRSPLQYRVAIPMLPTPIRAPLIASPTVAVLDGRGQSQFHLLEQLAHGAERGSTTTSNGPPPSYTPTDPFANHYLRASTLEEWLEAVEPVDLRGERDALPEYLESDPLRQAPEYESIARKQGGRSLGARIWDRIEGIIDESWN